MSPRHPLRTFTLGMLLLGLCVMFGSALYYRFNHGALMEERTRPQATRDMPEPAAAPTGMGFALSDQQTDDMGKLMAQLQEEPKDPALLMQIGGLFMEAKEWGRAGVFLSRAVVAAPSDPKPRYMLGITLFRSGKAQDSAKVFEDLLQLKDEPAARFNLAIIYKYSLNRLDDAKKLLDQVAASADPDLAAQAKVELAK